MLLSFYKEFTELILKRDVEPDRQSLKGCGSNNTE